MNRDPVEGIDVGPLKQDPVEYIERTRQPPRDPDIVVGLLWLVIGIVAWRWGWVEWEIREMLSTYIGSSNQLAKSAEMALMRADLRYWWIMGVVALAALRKR